MDEFAVKITGMEWPTNSDFEQYLENSRKFLYLRLVKKKESQFWNDG